jgi:hypothetical protein
VTWKEALALSFKRERDDDLFVKQEYDCVIVLSQLKDDLMKTTAEAPGKTLYICETATIPHLLF